MVGIQIGREQEEKKREEDTAFENVVDFNVTSNTEKKFAGATMSSAEDFKFDMMLQLDGEERERERCHKARGVYVIRPGASMSSLSLRSDT